MNKVHFGAVLPLLCYGAKWLPWCLEETQCGSLTFPWVTGFMTASFSWWRWPKSWISHQIFPCIWEPPKHRLNSLMFSWMTVLVKIFLCFCVLWCVVCISYFSVAMTKCLDKKQVKEERKGLFWLLIPEGSHPLWPQRYGNRQGKHGHRSRKMAGHIFIYTLEAGGWGGENRK